MSVNAVAKSTLLAASILFCVVVRAQDAFVRKSDKPDVLIKVATCSVSSVRDKSIRFDCTPKAAEACDGKAKCELPIGVNLTDGRDIDPVGPLSVRRLGKVVAVTYKCGSTTARRGPYHQSDNATLLLDCQ